MNIDKVEVKKGNLKLSKKVGIWSISANIDVCGRECKGCYAVRAQKIFKQARLYRERHLAFSKRDDFVEKLDLRGCSIIRVHESGEFYSQEYIDKWVAIAKKYPDVTFFSYTKRLKDFNFTELLMQPNFVMHSSLYDVGINFGKNISKRAEKVGGFVCPLTQHQENKEWHGKCGDECTWCMQKANQGTPIFFEKH